MEQKTKKIGSYIKLRLRNQQDGTYGIIDNLSMTRDTNKGITSVSYDNSGMPQKVSFSTASYTQYNYSADGEKLKCMHYTHPYGHQPLPIDTLGPIGPIFYGPLNIGAASSNIIKPGMTINLMDSTEYLGNFVLTNGKLDKYLFAGGYLTASESGAVFHYYTPDHLGNNCVVANESGTVEQVNHYYPYGGVMGESTMAEN